MIVCHAPRLCEALFLHSAHQVEYAGRVHPTAWHALAACLLPPSRLSELADCRSPEAVTGLLESALAGQEVPLDERLEYLDKVLRAKLDQHPAIWDEVLAGSKDHVVLLDENNDFLYSGKNGGGCNYVGKAWAKIRDERAAADLAEAA